MSSPVLPPPQILHRSTDPVLAGHQASFDSLVQEVTLWRGALAEWKARIERYRDAVEPLHRELDALWRQWLAALEHASLQPEFTRAERRQLDEMRAEAAQALQATEPDGPPHAAAPAEEMPDGSLDDWERRAAAAAELRAQRAAGRRAAAALKRRALSTQDASQSVRDVYRRVASALHPDREQDAQAREGKTALMQQANDAYARADLLALLELQWRAEQLDARHLAAADQRRLRHYTDVLQEQLVELQAEVRRLEAEFRSATGLPPGVGMQPRKADRLISADRQRLRADVQLLQRQVRSLQDAAATRLWLREQRRE